MRTQERNHPQGTIETLCGHRPNPALKFPSVGSIVSKELGSRDNMPPFVVVPLPTEGDFFNYEEAYRSGFLGPAYDSMILPDPSKPDFVVPDLSLPKSISAEAIDDRRTMLKIVDQYYRQENTTEFAKMDTFHEQALRMILSPHVKEAFNISQESEKTRDRYGRTRVGQSVLLARRLVEAGCRFVTAAGYTHGQWDTHGENDKRLRDTLARCSIKVSGSRSKIWRSAAYSNRLWSWLLENSDGLPRSTPTVDATIGPTVGRYWLAAAELRAGALWGPATNVGPMLRNVRYRRETCTQPFTRPWESIGPRLICLPSDVRST
jgi:hypothetical protein